MPPPRRTSRLQSRHWISETRKGMPFEIKMRSFISFFGWSRCRSQPNTLPCRVIWGETQIHWTNWCRFEDAYTYLSVRPRKSSLFSAPDRKALIQSSQGTPLQRKKQLWIPQSCHILARTSEPTFYFVYAFIFAQINQYGAGSVWIRYCKIFCQESRRPRGVY